MTLKHNTKLTAHRGWLPMLEESQTSALECAPTCTPNKAPVKDRVASSIYVTLAPELRRELRCRAQQDAASPGEVIEAALAAYLKV
jgi:hypothetical protein